MNNTSNIASLNQNDNNVLVKLDFNLKNVFNNINNLVLEKIELSNTSIRYFVLQEDNNTSFNFKYKTILINNNTIEILNFNNFYPEVFVYKHENKLYFFELTSGCFYPPLDGSLNLPSSINKKITQNNIILNKAFNSFYKNFFDLTTCINCNSSCLFLFNTHYKKYQYLTKTKLTADEINFLNFHKLEVFISEPILDKLDKIIKYDDSKNNILENLNFFCINNNIKINVNMCEFDIEKYQKYFKGLNLKTNDIFLKLVSFNLPQKKDCTKTLHNKIVCTTYRQHPSRYYVLNFLSHYYNDCTLSYYHYIHETEINDYFFNEAYYGFITFLKNSDMESFKIIKSGFNKLKSKAPILFDLKKPIFAEDVSCFYNNISFFNNKIIDCYNKNFCSIVCETVYDYHSPVISEKLFLCFALKNPFIIIAPPNTLKYVKDLGFKTFSNFWNEGYDEVKCPNERLNQIFKLIQYIMSCSYKELNDILVEMEEILEYNRHHVYNFFREKHQCVSC